MIADRTMIADVADRGAVDRDVIVTALVQVVIAIAAHPLCRAASCANDTPKSACASPRYSMIAAPGATSMIAHHDARTMSPHPRLRASTTNPSAITAIVANELSRAATREPPGL